VSPEDFMELVKRRPKVALRRVTDPTLRCAIKSYDQNRRYEEGQIALKIVERRLWVM
jgi:hypothetical protein